MLTPPIAPMLAAATPTVPESDALRGGCWYQPKFDGYRAVTFHNPSTGRPDAPTVHIQSRAGNLITSGFPDITTAIATQIPPGVVLDGELVVWDGDRVNFTALAGRLGATRRATRLAAERPATYVVFDVLAVEGTDIRHLPLIERQRLLNVVLADTQPPIQQVPTTTDVTLARQWLTDYAANPGLGMEGLVIKAGADPYTSGKRGWLKYRVRHTYDVVVGAVTGHRAAPNRLVLGYYNRPTDLRIAGSTIPLGAQQARTVGRLLTPADDGHPWPTVISSGLIGNWGPELTPVHLVSPTLVVEVSADTAFEHGRWRHLV